MNLCKYCHSEISENKKENTFCNRSCSNSYNNLGTCRNKRKLHNCKNCDKKIVLSRKFCSKKCLKEHNRKFKAPIVLNSGVLKGVSKGIVRDFLIDASNSECSKCNWSEISIYSKSVQLEINHIDGNKHNWLRSNLEVICPNCHSLTKYYRGRNIGRYDGMVDILDLKSSA